MGGADAGVERVCLLQGDVDTLDLEVVEDVPCSTEEDPEDVEAEIHDVVEDDLAPNCARTDR